MNEHSYIGKELLLFEKADNWKGYIRTFVSEFLKGDVLEVGAGMGATTRHLINPDVRRWVCLEPDKNLCRLIEKNIESSSLPPSCQVVNGTINSLSTDERFDAILYMDVIEHIEEDRKELALAAERLSDNGCLIVLAPAHQWLYSEFDKAIGHYRRYTRKSLASAVPEQLKPKRIIYLDSVGLLASLANKLVLRQPYPKERQIMFWDRVLVSASKIVDRVLMYKFGKSVLGVWEKSRQE